MKEEQVNSRKDDLPSADEDSSETQDRDKAEVALCIGESAHVDVATGRSQFERSHPKDLRSSQHQHIMSVRSVTLPLVGNDLDITVDVLHRNVARGVLGAEFGGLHEAIVAFGHV